MNPAGNIKIRVMYVPKEVIPIMLQHCDQEMKIDQEKQRNRNMHFKIVAIRSCKYNIQYPSLNIYSN